MLHKLYTMIDMMQEKYEDKRERIKLQEQLIAMKEEKQELLEKMHEMETHLHDAKEALAMYELEKQVCNSSLSSISSEKNVQVLLKDTLEEQGPNY